MSFSSRVSTIVGFIGLTVLILYKFYKNERGFLPILNGNHLLESDLNETCTLDFINNSNLSQDDPCIIKLIRKYYLKKPSPIDMPLNLSNPQIMNPTERKQLLPKIINEILRNKTGGFFIESGAHDGEYWSNTLYLEHFFGWTGILIEPNSDSFAKILAKNRKSWAVPVCLSYEKYPTVGHLRPEGKYGQIITEIDNQHKVHTVDVQCFPLYSILLAVGRTTIDFFSLDVEGGEMEVLRNIPWEKVNIKSLMVEYTVISEEAEGLMSFMDSKGYHPLLRGIADIVFIRKYID